MKITLCKNNSVKLVLLTLLISVLPLNKTHAQQMPPSVVKLSEDGQCTGVIFDARGYILTAEHCRHVNPKVYFADGRVLEAERVYEPEKNSIDEPTILKIKGSGIFEASKISVTMPQKGDAVTSWGFPVGNPQFNRGKITRIDQEIHVDFYTIGGNSGGPLFNRDGEIIGLASKTNKPFERGVPPESHWIPLQAIHNSIANATGRPSSVLNRRKINSRKKPVLYIFGSPT